MTRSVPNAHASAPLNLPPHKSILLEHAGCNNKSIEQEDFTSRTYTHHTHATHTHTTPHSQPTHTPHHTHNLHTRYTHTPHIRPHGGRVFNDCSCSTHRDLFLASLSPPSLTHTHTHASIMAPLPERIDLNSLSLPGCVSHTHTHTHIHIMSRLSLGR